MGAVGVRCFPYENGPWRSSRFLARPLVVLVFSGTLCSLSARCCRASTGRICSDPEAAFHWAWMVCAKGMTGASWACPSVPRTKPRFASAQLAWFFFTRGGAVALLAVASCDWNLRDTQRCGWLHNVNAVVSAMSHIVATVRRRQPRWHTLPPRWRSVDRCNLGWCGGNTHRRNGRRLCPCLRQLPADPIRTSPWLPCLESKDYRSRPPPCPFCGRPPPLLAAPLLLVATP